MSWAEENAVELIGCQWIHMAILAQLNIDVAYLLIIITIINNLIYIYKQIFQYMLWIMAYNVYSLFVVPVNLWFLCVHHIWIQSHRKICTCNWWICFCFVINPHHSHRLHRSLLFEMFAQNYFPVFCFNDKKSPLLCLFLLSG